MWVRSAFTYMCALHEKGQLKARQTTTTGVTNTQNIQQKKSTLAWNQKGKDKGRERWGAYETKKVWKGTFRTVRKNENRHTQKPTEPFPISFARGESPAVQSGQAGRSVGWLGWPLFSQAACSGERGAAGEECHRHTKKEIRYGELALKQSEENQKKPSSKRVTHFAHKNKGGLFLFVLFFSLSLSLSLFRHISTHTPGETASVKGQGRQAKPAKPINPSPGMWRKAKQTRHTRLHIMRFFPHFLCLCVRVCGVCIFCVHPQNAFVGNAPRVKSCSNKSGKRGKERARKGLKMKQQDYGKPMRANVPIFVCVCVCVWAGPTEV